ncbi:ATP-binding protein [Sporosarcina aquimarina]|uniref:ATP-binding protein n=1 Tax=Sporosarcina aquimarina TaxID=114975 RepID=UPI00203A4043|nr:ATP-binding protein [Sporosarcina aquimarina]MCM3756548.1 ATP-binding protein [Sporosarcina aquimarina]
MLEQLENVNSYGSLFVTDKRHPCILVSMDGVIAEANFLFCKKFSLGQNDNFLSLLKRDGLRSWNDFKQECTEIKEIILDNFALVSEGNVECLCKAHIIYLNQTQQAIVTFMVPAVCTELPLADYLGCFTHASMLTMIVNREGNIIDVNNRVNELFNLTRNAVIGKRVQSLYRKFNTQKRNAEAQYEAYIKTLHTIGEVTIKERFEDEPNTIQFFEIRAVYNSDSDLYIVEIQDCTEIEMLRRKLDHSGSLSTVGQMAASIAHEIRNPMTTLKGFVQLMEVTATGDTAKYLSVVDDELKRMEAILNEMLMLSKPSEEKISEFSLGVLITKVLEIMKPKAMFESIHIDWQDASFCNSMIYSNADKIKQVLLNIFKNAFEAMEPGGILTLKLEKAEGTAFTLSVTDTGKGMTPLQIKNIFMPFFTSKPEGTGLGLPFVLKTMEDLGGAVAVSSVAEKGTTFTLVFPQHYLESCVIVEQSSAN